MSKHSYFVCLSAIAIALLLFAGGICTAQDIETVHYREWNVISKCPITYKTVKFLDTNYSEYIPRFPFEELSEDGNIENIEFKGKNKHSYYSLEFSHNLTVENLRLYYWIFKSVEEAELYLVEWLNMTPIFMKNYIDLGLTGMIGDNCWGSSNTPGSTKMPYIIFLRNNVLVHVSSYDYIFAGGPYFGLTYDFALLVNNYLQGIDTVKSTTQMPFPTVHSIEYTPKDIDSDVSSLHINASSENNASLKYMIQGGNSSLDGIIRLGSSEEDYDSFKIWVWNEDFYFTSIDYYFPTTLVAEDTASNPALFTLFHNTPNPFNPATSIRFDLHEAADVRLSVYDMLGRAITTLVDEPLSAGNHAAHFDGAGLSSGVYVYRLTVGGTSETGRMTLMK